MVLYRKNCIPTLSPLIYKVTLLFCTPHLHAPPYPKGGAFVSDWATFAKRAPGEPSADNYDGRRGVCHGLSIGIADGQIRKKPPRDVHVAVFLCILYRNAI